jgi:hypothetical protein
VRVPDGPWPEMEAVIRALGDAGKVRNVVVRKIAL